MNCFKNAGTIFFLMFGFGLVLITHVFAQVAEPGRLVVSTLDKGFSVLKDPALQAKEKFPERRQRLWAEISPVFDFEEMSKRALGRYWKERTQPEKEEFIRVFSEILRNAYLGKSDAYSGQQLVYLNESQRGDRATVSTTFITSDRKEVAVDFRLYNRVDRWIVYDVIIEGVSLVNNYRSQFDNVLLKSSYEELIEKMREKLSDTQQPY